MSRSRMCWALGNRTGGCWDLIQGRGVTVTLGRMTSCRMFPPPSQNHLAGLAPVVCMCQMGLCAHLVRRNLGRGL